MLTKHATIRMQQRGIPLFIVDCLQQFGAEQSDRYGAIRYFFDKHSLKRLETYLGKQTVRAIERYRNCFAVVSTEGLVITTGFIH